jgi:DNA-binding NtrC family response regulator
MDTHRPVVQTPLIAVIENYPDQLQMFEELLTDVGYRVRLWSAASEAEAELGRADPDLLITGLWLETPDAGVTLLDTLDQGAETRTIPVIVCSAHEVALQANEAIFRRRGYRIVRKPFSIDELLAAVRQQLGEEPGGDQGVGISRPELSP